LKQPWRGIYHWIILLVVLPAAGFTQLIPNGDFEAWHTGRYKTSEPDMWETQNETGFVTVKEGTGHTGRSSACLSEQWDSMTQSFRGTAMTTTFDLPATDHPCVITGWVKGSPSNSDSLHISVLISAKSAQTGSGGISIFTTSGEWQSFTLKVNPGSNPNPATALLSVILEPLNSSHYQTMYCIDDLSLSETK